MIFLQLTGVIELFCSLQAPVTLEYNAQYQVWSLDYQCIGQPSSTILVDHVTFDLNGQMLTAMVSDLVFINGFE